MAETKSSQEKQRLEVSPKRGEKALSNMYYKSVLKKTKTRREPFCSIENTRKW